MADESIYEELRKEGLSRRSFLKFCGTMAGAMGFTQVPSIGNGKFSGNAIHSQGYINQIAKVLESKQKLPVIWLELQDCAGCSEALTRSASPTLTDLVLNKITIEYHETLSAAAGFQSEDAKLAAMEKYAGKYVLVVEGSVSTAGDGAYCTIGGKSSMDILREGAKNAAAIIATGNCAAYGGLPKAKPNPTGALGVYEFITDKPVVNIPGCPAIPEVFTGVLAHFLIFGSLPELDHLNRPKTFYGQTVHDRCLRRPFYEAGKFADSFDDEGAKKGWCLYKLGCKGPTTYNACASMKWSGGLSFPVQSGHPCLGCSEPDFWDCGGFYEGQSAPLDKPTAVMVGGAAAAGLVLAAGLSAVNNSQKKAAHQAEKPEEG